MELILFSSFMAPRRRSRKRSRRHRDSRVSSSSSPSSSASTSVSSSSSSDSDRHHRRETRRYVTQREVKDWCPCTFCKNRVKQDAETREAHVGNRGRHLESEVPVIIQTIFCNSSFYLSYIQ
jgi:hypothetical protein